MENTTQIAVDSSAGQVGVSKGHADKLIRSTKESLGLNSPFMQNNYLRITSSFRIAAEVLTVMSGNKFKTNERTAGATLAIVSNLLGVVFKQQPQLKEELDQLSDMSTGEYIALRLKQSLQPHKHIRQTLAANMMVGGVLGMVASVKSKRTGEGLAAAVGFVAACVLSFTKDEQKAWERHSSIMGSLAVPIQIGYGFEAGMKKGDKYIPAAMGLHAASHVLTFLETYGHPKTTPQKDDERSR